VDAGFEASSEASKKIAAAPKLGPILTYFNHPEWCNNDGYPWLSVNHGVFLVLTIHNQPMIGILTIHMRLQPSNDWG